MSSRSTFLIALCLAAIPSVSWSGQPGDQIRFKVTNLNPRMGEVENIHASCIADGHSKDLLCSMVFSSLQHSKSNSGKSHCEVSVTPIEPMKFKWQSGGAWRYISSPNLLCGEVSTYTLSKAQGQLEMFSWTLTIHSKETDLECVASMKRKPTELLTTYSFGGPHELVCDYLKFSPNPF